MYSENTINKRIYPSTQKNSGKKVKIQLKNIHTLDGYHINDKLVNRRKILNKYVKLYGYDKVIKRLNVLSIYNKNKYPEKSKRFKRDLKYIQRNF